MLNDMIDAYIETMLWSSVDEHAEFLNQYLNAADIAPDVLGEIRKDCEEFYNANMQSFRIANLTDEQIGHNFWLTRNRHGAGFWDMGLGELGIDLTEAAHAYGACDPQVIDYVIVSL